MKVIRRTAQFKRDVKLMQRRGMEMEKLKIVLAHLAKEEKLAKKYRDHVLVEQYKGVRECHITPDWMLIYESNGAEIILIRTGTHSDLFKR